MLEIPRTLEEITAAWLTQALAEGGLPDARVARVEPRTIGAGQGFMGQLSQLAITYESRPAHAPTSLVAKLPTADPGGQAMGNMMGLWERESRFYADVAEQVTVRVPRCYYNAARPEDTAYVLLLEDLAPLRAADQLDGASRCRRGGFSRSSPAFTPAGGTIRASRPSIGCPASTDPSVS